MKMGSYKFVMASTSEAVKEMLVQRSADYAGRPQTHFFVESTLGRLMVYQFNVRLLYNFVGTNLATFSVFNVLIFYSLSYSRLSLILNVSSMWQDALESSPILDFENSD